MIEVLSQEIKNYIDKIYLSIDETKGQELFKRDYNSVLMFEDELVSIDWIDEETKNLFYDGFKRHNENYDYNIVIPEVEQKMQLPKLDDSYNVKIKTYGNQAVFSVYSKPIRKREDSEKVIIQIKKYRTQNSTLVEDLGNGTGYYACDSALLDSEIRKQLSDNDFDDFYGFVKSRIENTYKSNVTSDYEKEERSIKTSLNRTKQKIYDLAYSNDWSFFVTLTFDDNKLIQKHNTGAWDYDVCVKELHSFFTVLKRNCSDIQYLGVPELHHTFYNVCTGDVVSYNNKNFTDKDYNDLISKSNRTSQEQIIINNVLNGIYKRRFHFHFLFNNFPKSKLTDSGKKTKDGQTIYNLLNYSLGFTTATEIKSLQAAQHYITKYVTKDLMSVAKGKKRYWSSKNLKKAEEITFILDDSEQRELKTILSDSITSNTRTKTIKVKNGNFENTINNYVVLKEEYNNMLLDLYCNSIDLGQDDDCDVYKLETVLNKVINVFCEDTYFILNGYPFYYDINSKTVRHCTYIPF